MRAMPSALFTKRNMRMQKRSSPLSSNYLSKDPFFSGKVNVSDSTSFFRILFFMPKFLF